MIILHWKLWTMPYTIAPNWNNPNRMVWWVTFTTAKHLDCWPQWWLNWLYQCQKNFKHLQECLMGSGESLWCLGQSLNIWRNLEDSSRTRASYSDWFFFVLIAKNLSRTLNILWSRLNLEKVNANSEQNRNVKNYFWECHWLSLMINHFSLAIWWLIWRLSEINNVKLKAVKVLRIP